MPTKECCDRLEGISPFASSFFHFWSAPSTHIIKRVLAYGNQTSKGRLNIQQGRLHRHQDEH